MRHILAVSLLLLTISRSFGQSTDKALLLQDVHTILLPDTPDFACSTIPCGDQVQVIAMGLSHDEKFPMAAIVISRLGKGKILILGSGQYFRKPLLDNKDIRQLVSNILIWGGKTIQLWGDMPDLAAFLHMGKYTDVVVDGNTIHPSTDILILTRDITDSVTCDALEKFIRAGGTLIFGSPVATVMHQQDTYYYLVHLNDLFIKAGLFHVYMSFQAEDNQGRLQTDNIPPHMLIGTLLDAAEDPHFHAPANEAGLYASTITNYLYHNDDTAATYKKIKKIFGPSGQEPIIPTPEHPVSKWNTREFLRYTVQETLSAKQMHLHPDPAYIHPASRTFPGAVDPAAKRVDEQIDIHVRIGIQGLGEPPSVYYRWHSTGLYIPPGEKVKIILDTGYIVQHLKAQIGVHDDDLGHMQQFTRNEHDLTRTFELTSASTEIYSSFGGLLIIDVPDTTSLKNIHLRVAGAVKAPYFRMGVTSVRDWQARIRNYPGPWAELASDKLILTVPAYRIRKLDDPEKLMRFWDEVMDADARLAAIPTTRKYPERIIIDRQVAFGALFTAPLKIVGPDDDNCGLMLDADQVRQKGSWGHFHELGHRHQFGGIDFDGLGEVTVNLYSMYVFDKVLHKGLYNHENISSRQAVIDGIKKYMAGTPDFASFRNDPFLALTMYIEIIENFGWESIEQVFKRYRMLPKEQYPATEADKRDYWFICISEAIGRDLSAFFDKWQIPVTEKAKSSVKKYPSWLPDELK